MIRFDRVTIADDRVHYRILQKCAVAMGGKGKDGPKIAHLSAGTVTVSARERVSGTELNLNIVTSNNLWMDC